MPVETADVFSLEEVARAAGVPLSDVRTLAAGGGVRAAGQSRFVSLPEAVRVARALRAAMAARPVTPPGSLFGEAETAHAAPLAGTRGTGFPAVASTIVHLTLLAVAILVTARSASTAGADSTQEEPARLVFLMTPGPGGGGGGGGIRSPRPASRLLRQGTDHQEASVTLLATQPITIARRDAQEPPKPQPVAPLLAAASAPVEVEGVIEHAREDESRGRGSDGGNGAGTGIGNGEGQGSGVGPGSDGGIGGGPYRPGSGIEPPRLLREVKADYTEEARRKGVAGSVVLEIVVRHDGTVGDITVLQGLGSGLDQRAIDAVRQWRFAPARRKGLQVDVIVEVSVEFRLR